GLLALAGILGVGEGHLFHHRKARRLVSGDFAKLGSLFQSFPRRSCLETLKEPLIYSIFRPGNALEALIYLGATAGF
ncbi:hypothetical protein NLO86_25935, partial [Pseudomonas savastanoi]|nr:hypothetical protein [Pseudomonas savastanoi]